MPKKRERPRLPKHFPGKSMTKQSFKEECDINTIMAKYRSTGLVDHVAAHQGRYDNLPDETDYHANLNSVMEAQETFDSLPAKIRARFDNDPSKFLGFVLNPENQTEIDEMGLGVPDSPSGALAPPAPPQGEEPIETPAESSTGAS